MTTGSFGVATRMFEEVVVLVATMARVGLS
jgi:hypothetical protein